MVPGEPGRNARCRADRRGRGKSMTAIVSCLAVSKELCSATFAFSRLVPSIAILALLAPTPSKAGLYYSGEHYAELPSRFRGFLLDHRSLRSIAIERPRDLPASPLREEFLASSNRLEKLAKTRALTNDEIADLGALYIRLGK